MYSTGIAYILWLISGFGALGFHRFYLGKIGTGLLYMFTGGLAGIGSVYDLLTLPLQVREANLMTSYRREIFDRGYYPVSPEKHGKPSMEQVILKTAKKNHGVVTPAEVALDGGFDLDKVKDSLEKLVSKGFAEIRVKKSGTYVYFFSDFSNHNNPDLEDF